ncbi:MAG: ATP-dependent zinc metalloprotease FtsH [Armatimonadota bacterium]
MKQNPIVIIIVILALVYAFYMIPQLSEQAQTHHSYEYYSDFHEDFKSEKIAEITIINNERAEGKFAEGANDAFKTFEVDIPNDEDVATRLMEVRPDGVKVGTSSGGWWDKLLMGAVQFLPFLLIIVLFYIFLMRQMRASGGQAFSFGRSQAHMLADNFPPVTFDDVAGMDEVKEELQEVVEFLRDPERFRALGAKIPRGVLLVGPPGCGKTLLARAVAGEAGVAFFYMSGSDFVEMFVGVGASRVRDLFEQAKANAPTIIFVDELDAVGRLRGAGLGGGHDEREQTLNALLVEMDGFDPNDDIILLAATNRPDILDPALLRPGRFDRRIVVPTPDVQERQEIMEIYCRDKPIADDVELELLARRTPGFSGADIENLVNEAALLAARREKTEIEMEDFDESIERVLAGPERKSRVIREDEREILAYHEAGHALTGTMLPDFDQMYKVTILPRGQSLGYTINLPEDERYLMSRDEMLNHMVQALGGRAAEEIVFGDVTTGAANDLEKVSKMAREMVTEYGMSEELGPITYGKKHGPVFLAKDLSEERNYSEAIATRIDNEVRRLVDEAYDRAKEILSENREILDTLVEHLLERETLNLDEVQQIIENGKLPPEDDETSETEDSDSEESEETGAEKSSETQREIVRPQIPEPDAP